MTKPNNWAELPRELLVLIFLRLSVLEILETAPKVCKSWYNVSKDPLVWSKIDIGMYYSIRKKYDFDRICRHVVDRSQGGLVGIKLGNLCSDSLLNYIADRSSNLRSLEFKKYYRVTDEVLQNVVAKLPALEELEVAHPIPIGRLNVMKAIGLSCPKLKTLKIVFEGCEHTSVDPRNNEAIDIAESMPELRHLQLFGHGLTNTGLNAILDGCPHLEYLDIRQCLNIKLVGDLKKRCSERIKVLRGVEDSTDDCPYSVDDDIDSEDDLGLAYDENEDNYNDDDVEVDYDQLAENVVAVVFYP